MILSKDATDDAGNVIVPAGTRVDRSIRNRLLMSRVRKVTVRGDTNVVESPNGTRTIIRPNPDEMPKKPDTVVVQENLLRLAKMFQPYRDDELMRELCRLAIKCVQERLISV